MKLSHLKKPGKPGQPAHEPTEAQRSRVTVLASFGVTQAAVADSLGVSVPTLCKHYRRELDIGGVRANVAVAAALFRMAMAGNVAACIFWLKARAGWHAPIPSPDVRPVVRIHSGGIN